MDRCNLTVFYEEGKEYLPDFFKRHRVEVVCSLPCYTRENVDSQRGNGTFELSVRGLQELNRLGYGRPDSGLELNLVYNPMGNYLPPPQAELEGDYRRMLGDDFGIVFNHLYCLTNMPITRFKKFLKQRGQYDDYLQLLEDNFNGETVEKVMCRDLLSVAWDGSVYDCDFNQMLDMPLGRNNGRKAHIRDFSAADFEDQTDPHRQPLLRLHRRHRQQLRRRPGLTDARADGTRRRTVGHPVHAAFRHHSRSRRGGRHRRRRRGSAATSAPHEIIVVDGGSTDRTAEIVRDGPARLVTSSRGRAAQMNEGARQATGELLLFLHADTTLPATPPRLDLDRLHDRPGLRGRPFRHPAGQRAPVAPGRRPHDQPALTADPGGHGGPGHLRPARHVRADWAAFPRSPSWKTWRFAAPSRSRAASPVCGRGW